MKSSQTSSRVAGRLAVFSTLAACCALLFEYILLSQQYVGYFGFVGFLLVSACALWLGFYTFARRYQTSWFEQVTENNKDLQLQALFSTLNPWPVLRFDRYGQLISKNSCAKTFFYTNRDGVRQRSVFDFFPELTKNQWRTIVDNDTVFEIEQNRSGFWLCFYFRPHGKLGVVNIYGYDVTRYKRNQFLATAQQASLDQKTMKAGHLLSEVLVALKVPTKAIHDACKSSDLNTMAIINTSSQHITNVLARLDDICHMDSSSIKNYSHSFDCQQLIEKVMLDYAKQAFMVGTELIVDYDLGQHNCITTDGVRLQKALESLFEYSIAHSHGRQVLIKIRWIAELGLSEQAALDHSVGVDSQTHKMVLRTSAHDSDSGRDEVLSFFNQSSSPQDIHGNIDLNLRFIHAVVNKIGGSITASGSALGGQAITVDWPVEVTQNRVSADPSAALKDVKVYVFDAFDLCAEVIAKTIARAGAAVQFGSDPSQLFKQLRVHKPDVLVYSLGFATAVDHQALNALRSATGHIIPVCLMTHHGEDLNQHKFNQLAVESIVTKPARSTLLIQGVLKTKQAQTLKKSKSVPSTSVASRDVIGSHVMERSASLMTLSSAQSEPKLHAPHHQKRPLVLVVDDDGVMLHLVSDLLGEIGADVEIAESAAVALDLLTQHKFDLVIMDVRMPVMNGFEATQEIRTLYGHKLPIIALTASEESQDRDKALQTGMNDFLTKPVHKETLIKCLGGWIDLSTFGVHMMQSSAAESHECAPVIEFQSAIRLLNKDVELFRRSLLRFYGRCRMQPVIVRQLLEQLDRDELVQRLHNMRGGAANIGAYQLRDRLFSAEKAIRQIGINAATAQEVISLTDVLETVLVEAGALLRSMAYIQPEFEFDQIIQVFEAGIADLLQAMHIETRLADDHQKLKH